MRKTLLSGDLCRAVTLARHTGGFVCVCVQGVLLACDEGVFSARGVYFVCVMLKSFRSCFLRGSQLWRVTPVFKKYFVGFLLLQGVLLACEEGVFCKRGVLFE